MHGQWMALRSMSSDQSVKHQKLKAGTLKRIFSYALPYRKFLAIFIFTVVIDAILIVATPLLLRSLVDDGVIPGRPDIVTRLALIVAALAIADAAFSMLGRWFSSRIGEGLIYDLRSQVFEHVQKQSIAFFTRTQTGSLISRINGDVIGAQQAFTSTLSGIVSNSLTLVLVVITMLTLSWQITLISLVLLPV
jgi:ATP-binding cassette subfamily B protein